jgi:agmatine deiminase
MPRKIVREGLRLPASYANFYIANRSVLVPTFADPADERALSALQDCFPSRRVVGIDSRELIWGLGTFHCLTQQQPAVL